jgi:TetR/AcrR family transcriptional regulator, regulator of biofilm formation and stress response
MPNVRNTERRKQILEAAVRIIGRDGPGAVTHRAVAAEAGVPLAATTYYFASKEALFNEALTLSVQPDFSELEELLAAAPSRLATVEMFAEEIARFLVLQVQRRRTTVVAQYELELEAARVPALRPAARASTDAYVRICELMLGRAGSSDPRGDARLLVALMDGLLLDQLSAPRHGFTVEALSRQLQRFIAGILGFGEGDGEQRNGKGTGPRPSG